MKTPFETTIGCESSPPVRLNVNVPEPSLTTLPAPPSLPAPLSVTSASALIVTSFAWTSAGREIVAASATVTLAYGVKATCSPAAFVQAATVSDQTDSPAGCQKRSAAALPPAVAV